MKRSHGQSRTPEYQVWAQMKARCLKAGHRDFKNYGGRGITVCDRWCASFEAFLADMGERPSSGHSIDRRNNDGPYDKDNCRWATRSMQMKNTRPRRPITEATRKRLAAAKRGRKLPEDHKDNIRSASGGWHHKPETIERLRQHKRAEWAPCGPRRKAKP